MDREIIAEPGQGLEDIALQEYGHVDAVAWVVFDNEDVLTEGFSTDLEPGTLLKLRDDYWNRPVYLARQKARIIPATGDRDTYTQVGLGDHSIDHNTDHF